MIADPSSRNLRSCSSQCQLGDYLRTLAAAGVVHSEGLLKSLIAAYQREAEDAVADGYAVAMINALEYQRHEEEIAVQTFAGG